MTQSENTAGAETAEQSAGIESLSELLSKDAAEPEPQAQAESDSDARGSDENAELQKFNDLAERLGVDLDALYKLEVSQADDGSPVTVEALKDAYAKQSELSLREIEFEEQRTERESKLMQAQEELRELMASLPEGALNPQTVQKLREKRAAQVDIERRRTLDVIPEWKDDARRTKDIEGMVDHLRQYGYPVNHLEQVTDHRQMKYIRDNYLREQRIRSALAKVRAGKPDPLPASKPAGRAPSKTPLAGVKRGNARDKLEAVFSKL